jgi:ABC-type ATPase involved in cell division
LCDEPTGNLDAERAKEVIELLQTAHVRGTTVVVATHDPALLSGGRRRIIAIDQGRVTHDAPAFADSMSSTPAETMLRLQRGDAA